MTLARICKCYYLINILSSRASFARLRIRQFRHSKWKIATHSELHSRADILINAILVELMLVAHRQLVRDVSTRIRIWQHIKLKNALGKG